MPDRPSHRRGRILTFTAAAFSLLAALGSLLPAAASAAAAEQPPAPEASAAAPPPPAPGTLRVVTYNASLFRREQAERCRGAGQRAGRAASAVVGHAMAPGAIPQKERRAEGPAFPVRDARDGIRTRT